jgi:ferredoxin
MKNQFEERKNRDKVEIYYFSGSGNSLAVARDVGEKLNADITAVMSLVDLESIDTEANVIGFVFPIYDFKPSKIMEKIISKIKNIESKYIFAICTYGITPAKSLQHLEKTIKSCGGCLSAGFAVGMPQSGIGSGTVTKAQQEKMFENWKNRLDEVSEYISNRRAGKIETSILFFSLFKPRIIKIYPILFVFLKHLIFEGIDSLAFISNEKCTGCGTCQRICSQNNIEIIENKPVWSDHCANCFACLNWCPNGAISLGKAKMGIKNYHHPDIEISDMIS